jgi:hypothetical protein
MKRVSIECLNLYDKARSETLAKVQRWSESLPELSSEQMELRYVNLLLNILLDFKFAKQ